MKQMVNKLSFKNIFQQLMNMRYISYNLIMLLLILLGSICNCVSNHTLPKFWLLTGSFAFMIYINIYAIKQVGIFYNNINKILPDEPALNESKEKYLKRANSNLNWAIILTLPVLIVPVVIYIIKYQIGMPVKIFAFSALYFIISLCFINYMQYIYLIRLSQNIYSNNKKIKEYNIERPHKTEWIIKISALTNKQSNLFFGVGSLFIFLLYQITFSGEYGVEIVNDIVSKRIVIYLWLIIVFAIILMFPIFSYLSYFFIKKLIDSLIDNSICKYEKSEIKYSSSKKYKKQKELVLINKAIILLLEKSPSYPRKPLVSYAFSYILAIFNFFAAIQATLSLFGFDISKLC